MSSSYEDVLRSLSEYKTVAAHISALGKLRLKTEDERLVNGIEEVISQLQLAHAKLKSKSVPVSVEKSKLRAASNLIRFCRQATSTKKPEWQILAERNGWAPKK